MVVVGTNTHYTMADIREMYKDCIGEKLQIFPFWNAENMGKGTMSHPLRTIVVEKVYDYIILCSVLNSKTGKKMFNVCVNKVDILFGFGNFKRHNKTIYAENV